MSKSSKWILFLAIVGSLSVSPIMQMVHFFSGVVGGVSHVVAFPFIIKKINCGISYGCGQPQIYESGIIYSIIFWVLIFIIIYFLNRKPKNDNSGKIVQP